MSEHASPAGSRVLVALPKRMHCTLQYTGHHLALFLPCGHWPRANMDGYIALCQFMSTLTF